MGLIPTTAILTALLMLLLLRLFPKVFGVGRRLDSQQEDTIMADVSHELRTPLTLILAPLESLLSNEFGPLPRKQRASLEIIHSNSLRLLQMINGLLEFSKYEAGKITSHPTSTDVVNLFRSICADFEPTMKSRDLECQLETALSQPVRTVDRYLLERILFNLLSNAAKFSHSGGKIIVRLQGDCDHLNFSVKDSGIGISREQRERIFERFAQCETDQAKRFEGTGLGLALTKQAVELLGGSITLESEQERGSVFGVRIPAPINLSQPKFDFPERTEPRNIKPISNIVPMPDPITTGRRKHDQRRRLLIVEDNEELAQYIASLLQHHFRSRIVRDGEQALKVIAVYEPEIIVSDIRMQNLDGLSLCRQVKSNPATTAIPFLLLTAQTERDALIEGWEAGADDYLSKPFHPKELAARVKTLLSLADGRRQLKEYRERQEELEQFNYIAAHHLREPIRTLLNYSQLLTQHAEHLDEEAKEYLGFLLQGSARLAQLISALGYLSKIATTPTQVSNPVDSENILRFVLSELDPRIKEGNAVVTHGKLPWVPVHPELLSRLFYNLIENSLKFKGADVSRISIGADHDGEGWCFEFKDNGIGFETEEAERVFNLFERLRPGEKNYSGVGAGLAICKNIVTRYRGRIWAESVPGKGTSIRFTIPETMSGFEKGESNAG